MLNKEDKILVTGATGFVGSYICRYLVAAGFEKVIGLNRADSSFNLLAEAKGKITWRECNILDLLQLDKIIEEVDVIIHAAALVSFRESDNIKMNLTNVKGTSNLVNLALERNIKKFIHISSVAALGKSKPGEKVSESSEWIDSKYNSPYALSKKMAEMEIWRAFAEGLNVSVLNPSIIFGAGFWDKTSVRIFGNMSRGQLLYPKGSNGFVDVRDVAKAVLLLLDSNSNGEKFLLNGANLSYKEIMDQISGIYGVPKPKYKINNAIIPISWRLMKFYCWLTRKETVYSRSTVVNSSKDWTYNNEKSIRVLGLDYIPLKTTIQETAQSFLLSKKSGKDFGLLPVI